MPLPKGPKAAREYYRAALKRLEEAQALFDLGYNTVAVYLSGYGIECMLKALILSRTTVAKQDAMLRSFRGPRGHDLLWLRRQYLSVSGEPFSREIKRAFVLVSTWSTDLRYKAATIRRGEAREFLQAAGRIVTWIERRV